MKLRLAYIILSLATAGLYLLMGVWSIPEIIAEADGLMPFDTRPMGYSADEAEAFLNALSEEGRVFYAETQHALDAVFPGLLAVWAGWTLWLLLPTRWAWGLLPLAMLGGAADYAENAQVARLLEGFDAETAQAAARWTLVKSAAVTVVLSTILIAVLVRGWRWARLRGRR